MGFGRKLVISMASRIGEKMIVRLVLLKCEYDLDGLRGMEFRDFANGRTLFSGEDAQDALNFHGPGGRVHVALMRMLVELRGLGLSYTVGVAPALTLDDDGNFKVILTRVSLGD